MLNQLDPSIVEMIAAYSDWRIYPQNIRYSCGLPDLIKHEEDNLKHSVRQWKMFNDVDEKIQKFIENLVKIFESYNQWESFSIDFESVNTESNIHNIVLRFRVQHAGDFYSVNKLSTKSIDLENLEGVTQEVTNFILSTKMQRMGGLMIACGDVRVGKSLFIASAMRARLEKYGGCCLVISDPIEHYLADDGQHHIGDKGGYVDYINVSKIGYSKALSCSLRTYPLALPSSLIFGEIRSDTNAFDLINGANNGLLIFTTMHALSPDAAIDRLITYCTKSNVSEESVRNILATSLRGISFHQYAHGKFIIKTFEATEEILKRIRNKHALPFQASAT